MPQLLKTVDIKDKKAQEAEEEIVAVKYDSEGNKIEVSMGWLQNNNPERKKLLRGKEPLPPQNCLHNPTCYACSGFASLTSGARKRYHCQSSSFS